MKTGVSEFSFKQGSLSQLGSAIEHYIQQDPGGRGLPNWASAGQLFPSASSLAGGKHILIITGFYILSAGTIETDGPPGTIVLADALSKSGKTVTILSDKHAEKIMAAGLAAAGCTAELHTFSRNDLIEPADIIRADTTHCVALERPGLAADGIHHNFRGLSISDHTARLDDVFIECSSYDVITVGIGDGGNELGMGNVSEAVDKSLDPYRAYSCKIPSDYCICAGVSNWAGYALAALISTLAGKILMPGFPVFSSIIDVIVAAGAVDGVTGKPQATVDSLPRDWEDSMYKQMYNIASQASS
jgi:hypothetical protein